MANDSPSTGDTSTDDDDPVIALLHEARLAFGAVLVDDEPRLVECLDRDRFGDDEARVALTTAVANGNADLVPFVSERRDEIKDEASRATEDERSDPSRIGSFDEVVSAVETSHACYLVVNTDPGEWSRVRYADAGEKPRYRVADAVVTAATGRLGNLPDDVDETDIEIIDWGE